MKTKLEHGGADIVLGTELHCPVGATAVATSALTWFGAQDGRVWKKQPLPIAYENHCAFRPLVAGVLDKAEVSWELAVDTGQTKTVEASVSADFAVHACLRGTQPPDWVEVPEEANLPELPEFKITLQKGGSANPVLIDRLAELITKAYAQESLVERPQHLHAV